MQHGLPPCVLVHTGCTAANPSANTCTRPASTPSADTPSAITSAIACAGPNSNSASHPSAANPSAITSACPASNPSAAPLSDYAVNPSLILLQSSLAAAAAAAAQSSAAIAAAVSHASGWVLSCRLVLFPLPVLLLCICVAQGLPTGALVGIIVGSLAAALLATLAAVCCLLRMRRGRKPNPSRRLGNEAKLEAIPPSPFLV